jgi:hypothetical protein
MQFFCSALEPMMTFINSTGAPRVFISSTQNQTRNAEGEYLIPFGSQRTCGKAKRKDR